jgi:histone deacetylase complex regulatory component SIN3
MLALSAFSLPLAPHLPREQNCKISEVEIDRPNSAEAKRAEHNRTSTKQTSEPRTSGQSVPRSESRRTGNASSTQPSIDFEQAINFVNKIKNTFKDDQMVYKNFLEILNRYRKNAKTIKQVDDEVSHLFKDYPSLLEEFRDFLPPDQLRQHTKRAAASSKRAEEVCPTLCLFALNPITPYLVIPSG